MVVSLTTVAITLAGVQVDVRAARHQLIAVTSRLYRDALDDVEVATSIPAFGGDRLRDLRGRLDAAEDVKPRGKRLLREVEEQVAAELTFVAQPRTAWGLSGSELGAAEDGLRDRRNGGSRQRRAR